MPMNVRLASILACGAFVAGCAGIGAPANTILPTSFELAAPFAKTKAVTSTADSGTGSLRAVVAAAKPNAKIVFTLRKKKNTIVLTSGPIPLTKNVTITGPGAPALLTISANGRSQIFTISSRARVTIAGVTLTKGSGALGGAISNGGRLTLKSDVLSRNIASGTNPTLLRPSLVAVRFDPRPASRRARLPKPPRAPAIPRPDGIASTTGEGAAVYNAVGAKLTASNTTFTKNEGALGGALYNAGSATLTADTFSSNTGFPGSGAPLSGSFAYGAAIYAVGNTTIGTCSFTHNTAGGAEPESFGVGGAIAQYSGTLAVSQSTFTSNVAGGGSHGSWGTGGAIYTAGGTLSLKSDTFTSNSAGGDAYGYGGAVYADQAFGGSANVFAKNLAYGTASGGYAYGGAVYAGGGITLTGDSFSSNSSSGGGASAPGYSFAGAIDSEGATTLSSVSFTSNTALGGFGGSAEAGAVYLGDSTNTWSGLKFSSNMASASGALSYAGGGALVAFAPLTIGGATSFSSNSAVAATSGAVGGIGGAAVVEDGPFSFAGTAANNSATTQGGAFWIDAVSTLTNATLSGNHVVAVQNPLDGGGAIYIQTGGQLTLSGSTLNGNSTSGAATQTGGGGIFNAGSGTIYNSTITSNQSSVDGGGIENASVGSFALKSLTVFQNVASGKGGNIKNLFSDAKMTLATSIVAKGSALTGADVSNDGTIASGDYNDVMTAVAGIALSGTTTHNLAVDPLLLALASNGGPTQTNADQSTSPGHAAIPLAFCTGLGITVDQRGEPRGPASDHLCDIGAYENQTP